MCQNVANTTSKVSPDEMEFKVTKLSLLKRFTCGSLCSMPSIRMSMI